MGLVGLLGLVLLPEQLLLGLARRAGKPMGDISKIQMSGAAVISFGTYKSARQLEETLWSGFQRCGGYMVIWMSGAFLGMGQVMYYLYMG